MKITGIIHQALEKLIVGETAFLKKEDISTCLAEFKSLIMDVQHLKEDNKLLEDRFQLLISQHEHIRVMMDDVIDLQQCKIKIPHRCPICNGCMIKDEEFCLPCDGTGIVWG